MKRILPGLVALTRLVLVAPAAALTAPGRVAYETGGGRPEATVDAAGATAAVALPDGGAVLVGDEHGKGFVALRLRADGSLDRTFGASGLAHVAVPTHDRFSNALQVLRRPDGRLLVVGTGDSASRYELPRLVVAALTEQGALDPSFGQGGLLADAGIQGACGSCDPAALTPDGSLVLAGVTGQVSPAIEHDRNAPATFQWVVERLTPTGAPDASFGGDGIVDIPVAAGRDAGGYAAAVLADGRIVTFGRDASGPLLARLTPAGGFDPTFHGGTPAPVPLAGARAVGMAAHPDGTADVFGQGRLARLTPAGDADPAFGPQGIALPGASAFARPVALPDGGVAIYGPSTYEPRPTGVPALIVERIAPSGAVSEARVPIPFGGGYASVGTRVPSIAQNSFLPGRLVPRADGSFLVAGGVRVVRYTGEGSGFSSAPMAAAALTPQLALDPAFGGPRQPRRCG
jgi:uncharacterized delta-60 repeat protein